MTTRAPKNTSFALVSVTKNYHFLKKVSRGTPHTVPEQELKISKKWLYGNLDLLIETTHSFCRVIILLHSNSQAHKVAHASLGPRFGQHSANFHRVIEYVTDIFFAKIGTFGTVCPVSDENLSLVASGILFATSYPHFLFHNQDEAWDVFRNYMYC